MALKEFRTNGLMAPTCVVVAGVYLATSFAMNVCPKCDNPEGAPLAASYVLGTGTGSASLTAVVSGGPQIEIVASLDNTIGDERIALPAPSRPYMWINDKSKLG